ncbi:MAG: Na+/H+ antiporter subunit D [Planctomycetota bacterium]|nr:MAG: Na+/H+ antiporter subunit D [Planctomycetota bacterium]
MNLVTVLPIVIPLVTAIVSLFAWRSLRVQRWISLAGAAGLLGSAVALLVAVRAGGIQATQIGDWPAPYGITFVADHLTATMVLLAGIIGMAVVPYSCASVDREQEEAAYHPLLHVLLMGVCGAFLTGDLFNLYVWFEVMLISSFVLMGLGGRRPQLEGALKYVALNLIASFIFLVSVGLLYAAVGTLNMADLATRVPDLDRGIATSLAMSFLVAFGVKAAVFPLFFWLPASYHTQPAAVAAIFAGLLTKVGVYAMFRVFTLVFVLRDVGATQTLLLVLSMLTMVTGVLGAVAQNELRRLLSFHIISQIGYMVVALALFTPLSIAAGVFFVAHNTLAKSTLFLVSGVVERRRGTYDLDRLGGTYRESPWLALLFALPALALAGIPPLSGFVAKLEIVQAGLEADAYIAVATALAVSLLTLFSMSKIWNAVFWQPPPASEPPPRRPPAGERWLMECPTAVMAAFTVVVGLAAGPLFGWTQAAADELLGPFGPSGYVERVLGEQR